MKGAVKKELLYDLQQAITILEKVERSDLEELKKLSDHAIEDVALYKDMDIVSVTVMFYSIYKLYPCFKGNDHLQPLREKLVQAHAALQGGNLGKYNQAIKVTFDLLKECNTNVKKHLQDVMQAARIRKGTTLLEKGLSMGQAAGLMGLTNWDLQEYAAKTTALNGHTESYPAHKRLRKAFALFGVKP